MRKKSDHTAADGHPLAHAARKRRREHHRRIQLVPQNPLAALNPSRTIGATLTRPLRRHTRLTKAQTAERITELLDQVGLSADFVHRYPHELSGRQRPRVSIARALTTNPDFLLCDEAPPRSIPTPPSPSWNSCNVCVPNATWPSPSSATRHT
ncbi:ATP-binding cassette domain-containing protein [Streptomyces sp. NBC_01363]|uniref:ATP-binding cassette domain-containing protein n=1 Tax=Streptomyces sp. NBC_01363 TaxID=2903840 RepID=UPI002255DEF3|nr:ATP-binding cassette domain-containing protein [Streptomyces sp. NBC_01363]MCX4733717.1 ATP-binding cassette domain-containing protein [Streptomyces sp. NBC_01363]